MRKSQGKMDLRLAKRSRITIRGRLRDISVQLLGKIDPVEGRTAMVNGPLPGWSKHP